MIKPLQFRSPKEKAELIARLKLQAEKEGDMPMILGNLNNLLFARPTSRRKPAIKRSASISDERAVESPGRSEPISGTLTQLIG